MHRRPGINHRRSPLTPIAKKDECAHAADLGMLLVPFSQLGRQ